MTLGGASIAQEPDTCIYGQKHPLESPDLIRRKLKEFDETVTVRTRVQNEDNASLIEATKKCPHLLTKSFKLMFLRCELFNTDLAVTRYCKYWNKRVAIFGEVKAFQPLTLEKAMVDDEVALGIGYARLLEGVTDPKGRSIIFGDSSLLDKSKYTRESMCRAVWYVLHAALERETCQKHGIVLIGDPSRSRFGQFDRRFFKMLIPSVLGVLPIRVAASHVCNAPTFVSSVFFPMIKVFLPDRLTKRVFFHSGSCPSLVEKFQKFGLDKSMIPQQVGGHCELKHGDWLQERRSKGR